MSLAPLRRLKQAQLFPISRRVVLSFKFNGCPSVKNPAQRAEFFRAFQYESLKKPVPFGGACPQTCNGHSSPRTARGILAFSREPNAKSFGRPRRQNFKKTIICVVARFRQLVNKKNDLGFQWDAGNLQGEEWRSPSLLCLRTPDFYEVLLWIGQTLAG
jgi:hypothetical protein